MSIIWLVWWWFSSWCLFFFNDVAVYPDISIVHYRVTLLKSWNPESSEVLSSVSFLSTEIVTRSISCCSSSLNVIMCDGFLHVVALHIDSELELSIFYFGNFLSQIFFYLYYFNFSFLFFKWVTSSRSHFIACASNQSGATAQN